MIKKEGRRKREDEKIIAVSKFNIREVITLFRRLFLWSSYKLEKSNSIKNWNFKKKKKDMVVTHASTHLNYFFFKKNLCSYLRVSTPDISPYLWWWNLASALLQIVNNFVHVFPIMNYYSSLYAPFFDWLVNDVKWIIQKNVERKTKAG